MRRFSQRAEEARENCKRPGDIEESLKYIFNLSLFISSATYLFNYSVIKNSLVILYSFNSLSPKPFSTRPPRESDPVTSRSEPSVAAHCSKNQVKHPSGGPARYPRSGPGSLSGLPRLDMRPTCSPCCSHPGWPFPPATVWHTVSVLLSPSFRFPKSHSPSESQLRCHFLSEAFPS